MIILSDKHPNVATLPVVAGSGGGKMPRPGSSVNSLRISSRSEISVIGSQDHYRVGQAGVGATRSGASRIQDCTKTYCHAALRA
jgi:hypothetical protein